MGLIKDIKEHIASLLRSGLETTIFLTPGHADIAGKEQADKQAKEATAVNTSYKTFSQSMM